MQIPRLREWREARALTQVELADQASVSPRSVASYEAGGGARPQTVRKLAAALGVEIADLRGEHTDPKAQSRSSFEPPLFNGDEGGRPTPALRDWINLTNRLISRWEQEITERENAWRDAAAPVRKHVKWVPNLSWAVEISMTAADVMDIVEEVLERALGEGTSREAVELFSAFREMGRVIDRTKPWFEVGPEDAPGVAQVFDIRERLERMEKQIGSRAS